MSHEPNPLERLILWRLAVVGGEDWQKDIKPKIEATARQRLVSAGLIEADKRKHPSNRAMAFHISLTDRGWAWLSEHVDAELSKKSTAGTAILQQLLGRLKTFVDVQGLTLAEFIQMTSVRSKVGPSDLEQDIEAAYLRLSGARPNIRVRLADLRAALPDVPYDRLNAALLGLASNGKAALYRLDNPLEIRPEDQQAVLRTPSGEERHLIYLGGQAI